MNATRDRLRAMAAAQVDPENYFRAVTPVWNQGVRADVLLPPMRAVSPECDIVIEEVLDAPGLDERGNTYLARAVMLLLEKDPANRFQSAAELKSALDLVEPDHIRA